MKIIKKIIFFSLIIILFSCQSQKFDRKIWNKSDGGYNLREPMVDDVIKNHLYIGMKYSDVINLLGKPNGKMSKKNKIYYVVFYDLYQELHMCLTINFTHDSIVKSYSKVEWTD